MYIYDIHHQIWYLRFYFIKGIFYYFNLGAVEAVIV